MIRPAHESEPDSKSPLNLVAGGLEHGNRRLLGRDIVNKYAYQPEAGRLCAV